MDRLGDYEAFLREIFDNPDDDTPRLVFADLLEEHGEGLRAAFIRWQCGHVETSAWQPIMVESYQRGFRCPPDILSLPLSGLKDAEQLRLRAVYESPEWFGVKSLKLEDGLITSSHPIESIFQLSVFARINELNLEGKLVQLEDPEYPSLTTYHLEPVITTAGVEALARCRGVWRIRSLDLRNNNLDNEAARALVRSPFLANLKRLHLLDGNRLRGRVWQQVIERFGEEVVG
jgi:uncharacterized protein (TIGR02996 family)